MAANALPAIDQLRAQHQEFINQQLNLDLTRGKPCTEQVALSDALDGILGGDYIVDGTDVRNYGGLLGLPAARQLFGKMIGASADETIVGGNSSLQLMHYAASFAMHLGVAGGPGWAAATGNAVKFLCPVPGYDRHFAICEQLGIEMIPVAMHADGPDMDAIEQLLREDQSIMGIWCVPRFSNPTGIVYSDAVVQRFAQLGKIAAPGFRIFWDNAYAVHSLTDDAPELANLLQACKATGTEDSVYLFGSTSKITHAGAGVGFAAMSATNLKVFQQQLGIAQIGPDKINQARHLALLPDMAAVESHMRKHAAIIQPRFAVVLDALQTAFADSDEVRWESPQGGYFVSLDVRSGTARQVVALAAEAGVKLTPAGATFPLGHDPEDSNIRIAPTYPALDELKTAMAVLVNCVQLASAEVV